MAYGSGVQRPLSQAGLHLICNHHLATGGIKSKLVRERFGQHYRGSKALVFVNHINTF